MANYGYNERIIQEAITFLVENFARTGHNSKPVVTHSLRVASLLWNNNASEAAVIAAILHDVIEDTEVELKDVKNRFGETVSQIVESMTIAEDPHIDNPSEAAYLRASQLGFDALVVRASDLIDNSYYYERTQTKELRDKLKSNYVTFMKIAKETLKGTIYWDLLKDGLEKRV